MRGAWVVLTPLLAGGCVPPAIAVASYAVDGASYVATGKSVEDHAVSTVKNEDCATHRIFIGGVICKDPNHPAPRAPLEVRNGTSTSQVAAAPPQSSPAAPPPVAPAMATAGVVLASAPAEPVAGAAITPAAPGPVDTGEHYLVVGSYATRATAERVAASYADFRPQIVAVTRFSGSTLSRVVLGPLDSAQMAFLRGRGAAPTYVVRAPTGPLMQAAAD